MYNILFHLVSFIFPFHCCSATAAIVHRSAQNGSAPFGYYKYGRGFMSSTLTALPPFSGFFFFIIFFPRWYCFHPFGAVYTRIHHCYLPFCYECLLGLEFSNGWVYHLISMCICIYDERYLAAKSIVNMYRVWQTILWNVPKKLLLFSRIKFLYYFTAIQFGFIFSNINKPAVCQMVWNLKQTSR